MRQFLLFLSFAVVVPTSAQPRYFGSEPFRPTGFFGVGFSSPVNPLANRLDTGWNLAGGIGVTQPYVGLNVDAMYNDFGISHAALVQAGARNGSQKYWAVTVDPIFHVNDRGPVDFYITGGAGLYGRHTNYRASSTTAGSRLGEFDLTRSDDVYRPGVDLGVGFAFNLSDRSHVKLFAEARYHHMFTPGTSSSFIPVTVGVRF